MNFLKRLLGQEGINGVIVALLLILIGVGAIMGISAFMDDAKDRVIADTNTSVTSIIDSN